jgi:UDP-GlcNAc:undecaprenyl-phosphate/decaprenyl-phosphate GlcNAc-1-phosphate transferase
MTYALFVFGFFAAVAAGSGLTWKVRNVAVAQQWVVSPRSARHLHKTAIPRLGGIAIFAAFAGVAACALALARHMAPAAFSGHVFFFVLLAAAPSFLVGLYDDFRGSRPWLKIAAQVAGGAILYAGGIRVILGSAILRGSNSPIWSLLLTVVWTVLIGNAFNLIDGLDGLAAGSALFSTLAMFIIAMVNGNWVTAVLTVVLAGATLGFLRYNFNPASIFLGDCGSLTLGSLLASLALAGVQQKSSTLMTVGIPVIAFGLPIVETGVSVLRRWMSGRPLFDGDREHIHHKLLDLGISHREAVVVLYGVSGAFGLMSLMLLSPWAQPLAVVLLIFGGGIVVGLQRLGYHEFDELERIARRTMEQRQVIINNLAVRRGAEKLGSCRSFEDICRTLDESFGNNDFDGFVLQVPLRNEAAVAGFLDKSTVLAHTWNKEQEPAASGSSFLSVTLEFATDSSERKTGRLVLTHRMNGPLLADIDLLTSEYAPALGNACRRVFSIPAPAANVLKKAALISGD